MELRYNLPQMTDWKQLVSALGLPLNDQECELVITVLDAIGQRHREFMQALALQQQPAFLPFLFLSERGADDHR